MFIETIFTSQFTFTKYIYKYIKIVFLVTGKEKPENEIKKVQLTIVSKKNKRLRNREQIIHKTFTLKTTKAYGEKLKAIKRNKQSMFTDWKINIEKNGLK